MANDLYQPPPPPTYDGSANKLKTFSDSLQKSGSPTSRPPDWFLKGGVKKVTVQPDEGGGGKWICSLLLRKGIISVVDFCRLARGHAMAIVLFPNFAYWYLTVMRHVAQRAEDEGHDFSKFPMRQIEFTYQGYGFTAAYHMYRSYCLGLWAMYGRDLPHPDTVHFGAVKLLLTGWFWKSIPNMMRNELRLRRVA